MLLMEYDYDTDIKVQRKEAYNDGLEQGVKQGIEQQSLETARNMLTFGYTVEEISKITNLPLEKIENLAKSNKN